MCARRACLASARRATDARASCCVAQSDLYGSYCPSWALAWNYRRQNLLRELLSYGADILCLQEARARRACAHAVASAC